MGVPDPGELPRFKNDGKPGDCAAGGELIAEAALRGVVGVDDMSMKLGGKT